MQFVGWRRFEFRDQVQIEVPGLTRLGVHQQPPAPDLDSNLEILEDARMDLYFDGRSIMR